MEYSEETFLFLSGSPYSIIKKHSEPLSTIINNIFRQ